MMMFLRNHADNRKSSMVGQVVGDTLQVLTDISVTSITSWHLVSLAVTIVTSSLMQNK